MYPHTLLVPCLGYEIANYFWENYPDELRDAGGTTQYVGRSGADLKKGQPLFLWSMNIQAPSQKGIWGFLKPKKYSSEAFVRSPVSGALVGVPSWETMFSNDKTAAELKETDGDDVHEEQLKQFAAFIQIPTSKHIPAIKPYEEYFDLMRRLAGSGQSWLGDLVHEETSRLKRFSCPVVSTQEIYETGLLAKLRLS